VATNHEDVGVLNICSRQFSDDSGRESWKSVEVGCFDVASLATHPFLDVFVFFLEKLFASVKVGKYLFCFR
jgi:hypothetical protein